MGDTEPSDNTLHKIKQTRSSILIDKVGLDPVATSYLVGWIKRPPTSLARSYLTT